LAWCLASFLTFSRKKLYGFAGINSGAGDFLLAGCQKSFLTFLRKKVMRTGIYSGVLVSPE